MKTPDTYIAASIACAFFGRILQTPPSEALLFPIRDEHLFAQWPMPLNDAADAHRNTLEKALADVDADTLKDLQDDFNTLFIVPDTAVPVWESVWTTEERLLFSDCTFAVREAYAKYSIEAPHLNKEPDDHIGLELAFTGHLLALLAEAVDTENTDSIESLRADLRDFMDNHLLRWTTPCLEAIGSKATTQYYKACAALCDCTIKDVAALLR